MMLRGCIVLVSFQIAGDFIRYFTGLPMPGPVIGMALLLVALCAGGRLTGALDQTANGVLSLLPMLFVPAGAGVMAHFDLIRAEWAAIAAAVVLSSVFAVITTAATARGLERLQHVIRKGRGRHTQSRIAAQ
jgi:holin-like protein